MNINELEQLEKTDRFDVKSIALEWTEPHSPNGDCMYNHSIAETAFGRFLLTWKGWKDYPEYVFDETPWDSVECRGWATITDAQEWAAQEMARRIHIHIAAANPSAISELIAAYREAVAALKYGWSPYYTKGIDAKKMAEEVFETAKRLGVE